MRKYLIYCLLSLVPLVSYAGFSEQDHTGCRRHVMLSESTHVRDSGLLRYDVNHYGISLEVNDTSTYISGYTDISATALEKIDELVFELSSSLQLDSVFIGEIREDSFTHIFDLVRISPVDPVPGNEQFRARLYYHGSGGHSSFFAGISNRKDMEWDSRVTYTLSEPFRALDWFPCKQVLHDKADSADIYITVGEGLMAGSNGILVGIDSLSGGKKRYHWQSRYPVAYYLLSITVSNYQDYSFYSKSQFLPDSLLIQNYIYNVPGCLEQNRADIDVTADLIDLYSGLFSPYPFWKEKYGHCLAPMGGGMEHQTMTTLASFRFNLVAHELTHQWFGDNVTCASWQDIWINEGFASYGEYLAREALLSHEEADKWMNRAHELAMMAPGGSVYIPEGDADDEIRIFSSALSYKKGAALVHMLRYELQNDSLFFRTLSVFQERYADSVATGRDFLNVLNEISGSDFEWFFEQWYYGYGYPQFQVTWQQSYDSIIVEISQSGSSDKTAFFKTSMDLEFHYEIGGDTLMRIFIDEPEMRVGISLSRPVIKLVPDPENWILDITEVVNKTVRKDYFKVRPNPFGEKLNIVFRTGIGDREIILCDLHGKILKKCHSTSGSFTMDTHDLIQGVYLLKISEGKEVYTARVIRH